MTLPELFAAQYARTNGDLVACFRAVLEADAMLKRRPPVRIECVDDEWLHSRARNVVSAVALRSGLTLKDMTGPARISRIARARHLAMLMVRETTGLSYPSIGVLFGRRDHSTVIAGCESARARIAERPALGEELRALADAALAGEAPEAEAAASDAAELEREATAS